MTELARAILLCLAYAAGLLALTWWAMRPYRKQPRRPHVFHEPREYISGFVGNIETRYDRACPSCGANRTIVNGLPHCPNFGADGYVHPIYGKDGKK